MYIEDSFSSESFVDCLINQSPYPIWISDHKGTLLKINPSCKELLKITEEEVVGIYNILEDNLVEEQGFMPLVRRVFEEGETARFEIKYDSARLADLRLANTSYVILDVTIFAIKNAEGRITNAVIQHVDITSRRLAEEALHEAYAELEERVRERTADLTAANDALVREMSERKLAEEELRRSEEQFRTLCESAPIGIFKCDDRGVTQFGNRRLRDIGGLAEGEPLFKTWSGMIHHEDIERVVKEWEDAKTTEKLFFSEYRLITPHRGEVLVRALAAPIRAENGEFIGYVGTVEDITEVSRAREEMLKSQKLESLGVLAGGIAHDFNNILMIVLGYVSIAHSRADDPDIVRSRLADAEKGILRARDLTHQLITFARGGDPVKRLVRLNELLQEATRFASLGSIVSCTFDLADDLALVEADEGQLSQVVHNLVINAIQAMPEGGEIIISSENTVSRKNGQKMVKITLKDTGIGIPPQHRARIFDPYFTTKQQGSGLGLASCYSIIRKHGGDISVASTLGKGSTFTVFLPATEPVSLEGSADPVAADSGYGRVLLMDDDRLVAEIALSMLEELGYEAEWTADGAQAIDLYRRRREEGRPFSAVIMDLTVPGGMGGKEAMTALVAYDPKVQGVVSSGYSSDPVLAGCAAYGFSAVLTKPYTLQEMATVLRALHQQALMSAGVERRKA